MSRTCCLLVAALVLPGCAVGPDYKPAPAPVDAPGFTREPIAQTAASGVSAQVFNTGSDISAQWWQAFQSPALNARVERALAHSPTLGAAEAALSQARENTAAQYGAYFPSVQADYSPSRQRNAVGTISPTLTSGQPVYTLHTAQLSVSYAADVFGLNRRQVESLQAQEDIQRDQLWAARQTLAANVVAASIQEAGLRAQLTATQALIDANSEALRLVQRQAELGFATGLDVAAQQAALALAQQQLPPLQRTLAQTHDLLAVLGGDMPTADTGAGIELTQLTLPADLPVSLPSHLVNNRPDLRAAAEQVHSASAQVGVALANRFPQFSLSAAYGGSATQFSQMFSSDNIFWAVTGNVTAPLFDFGVLRHRQHAAEAALEQAKAQYREAVLGAFQNVADSLYALDADARALAGAQTAETAAQRTTDLTRRQVELGYVARPVLLAAEIAQQQAVVSRVQAEQARYTDTVALFQALGGPWQEPGAH